MNQVYEGLVSFYKEGNQDLSSKVMSPKVSKCVCSEAEFHVPVCLNPKPVPLTFISH